MDAVVVNFIERNYSRHAVQEKQTTPETPRSNQPAASGLLNPLVPTTETLFKPIILPTMLYHAMSFMWSVGTNITTNILSDMPRELGGYGFGSKAVGFLDVTPIAAVIIGEMFCYLLKDSMANRYIRTHHGHFSPEMVVISR